MNKVTTSAEIKAIADGDATRGTRMTVRLSRTSTDRDGEVIDAGGWKVPTGTVNVLVNHDNRIECVVGKLVSTSVEGDDFMGVIEYADNVPENTLARFVVAMHKSGQLGPVSVGFIPQKWIDPDGKTYTRENPGQYWGALPGRKYVEQELLELSEVAVGSHRDAMVLVARAFGLSPAAALTAAPAPSDTSNTQNLIWSDGVLIDPAAIAYTDGDGEKAPVSWFDKLFGAHPELPADEALSRDFDDRLNEAEDALEAARKAVEALRSAKRAGEKEAA